LKKLQRFLHTGKLKMFDGLFAMVPTYPDQAANGKRFDMAARDMP
jgi:hypothetical protein